MGSRLGLTLLAFLSLFPLSSFSQSISGTTGAGAPRSRTGMHMECRSPMKAETGSPYSITLESEENRPGSGIPEHLRSQTRLTKTFRDSQGRTREERYMPVPPGAPQNLRWLSIRILDPVAGVGYMFNMRETVAIRVQCAPVSPRPAPTAAQQAAAEARQAARSRMTSETESLGTQTIQGVLAEGMRTTTTYPAGSVNNDQPFVGVHEVWYSPELKMEVFSKSSDPLRGEFIERLAQIDRSEPDPSLFLPPSDYAIEDQ